MGEISNDDLEQQGLVECCSHCNSLHITIEDSSTGNLHYCNNCGIADFTEIITEEEWEERNKVNC